MGRRNKENVVYRCIEPPKPCESGVIRFFAKSIRPAYELAKNKCSGGDIFKGLVKNNYDSNWNKVDYKTFQNVLDGISDHWIYERLLKEMLDMDGCSVRAEYSGFFEALSGVKKVKIKGYEIKWSAVKRKLNEEDKKYIKKEKGKAIISVDYLSVFSDGAKTSILTAIEREESKNARK